MNGSVDGRGRRGGPLANKVVAITRTREDAGELVEGVERLGGSAVLCPTIRIEFEPAERLAAAVGDLNAYQWVVFTSANAVRAAASLFLRVSYSGTIAVVGNRTAEAVARLGCTVTVQPEINTGETLAAELVSRVQPADRVLLPQSAIARKELADVLAQGGADVRVVTAYATVRAREEDVAELRTCLRERAPDAVLFASPSAVRGLCELLEVRELEVLTHGAALFSIGPSTTKQIRSCGFSVAGEAAPHHAAGLLDAVRRFFEGGA